MTGLCGIRPHSEPGAQSATRGGLWHKKLPLQKQQRPTLGRRSLLSASAVLVLSSRAGQHGAGEETRWTGQHEKNSICLKAAWAFALTCSASVSEGLRTSGEHCLASRQYVCPSRQVQGRCPSDEVPKQETKIRCASARSDVYMRVHKR